MSNDGEITITVCPGLTKKGKPETFDHIDISPGDTISINRGTRPQIAVLTFRG